MFPISIMFPIKETWNIATWLETLHISCHSARQLLSCLLLTVFIVGCGGANEAEEPMREFTETVEKEIIQKSQPDSNPEPKLTEENKAQNDKNPSENTAIPVAITSISDQQLITTGQNLQLTVTATGTQPIAYQWYLGDTLLEGQSTTTLTIGNAQPTHSGVYKVNVANSVNQVTSDTVQVSVLAIPKESDVQVSWNAPTTRADGSPLSAEDIAHYKIQLGTSQENLAQLSTVETTSITLADLPAGKHVVAVSTVDSAGLESDPMIEIFNL